MLTPLLAAISIYVVLLVVIMRWAKPKNETDSVKRLFMAGAIAGVIAGLVFYCFNGNANFSFLSCIGVAAILGGLVVPLFILGG